MIEISTVESPVGPLTVVARDRRVCTLSFGTAADVRAVLARWYRGEAVQSASNPAGAVTALASYFAGDLAAIDDLAVELRGTPFQQRVWERLRSVRAGTTATYGEIARSIGTPAAVRAVGAANGANPVALIVPCHRIIGSGGQLTGYGGGLEVKRWLLAHESGSRPLAF